MAKISFERHGLGDSCNFLRLVRFRKEVFGEEIQVKLSSKYDRLRHYFNVDGYDGPADVDEKWEEVDYYQDDPIKSNKTYSKLTDEERSRISFLCSDLTRPVLPPIPDSMVDRYTHFFQKPLFVVHAEGISYRNIKRLEQEELVGLIDLLVKETGGTVLLLDADKRYSNMDVNAYGARTGNVVHCQHMFTLDELIYLLSKADLVIGVDSGIFNLARTFGFPSVGLFDRMNPVCYHFPDRNSFVFSTDRSDWKGKDAFDRWSYPFRIGYTPSYVHPKFIAFIREVLDGKDPLIADYLTSVQYCCNTKENRRPLFEHALQNTKNVLEIGSIRSPRDYTAGYSSYLFALNAEIKDGHLTTVDIDTSWAKKALSQFRGRVEVIERDSVEYLQSNDLPDNIDGVYLDGLDADKPEAADQACFEYEMIKDRFDGFIYVDDTTFDGNRCQGKGAKIFHLALMEKKQVQFIGQGLVIRNRRGLTL